MLLIIGAVLLLLWLLGFSIHIGGGFINLLLVIALIVFIAHMISNRRAV